MHILIIEDDLDLGQALLAALRQAGMSALWVRTQADGLGALAEPTDCVLLDLGLPDGEGLDLLADWRARNLDVPVIIMTARAGLDERLLGLDRGADDFLVKPFAPAELIARLRAVGRRYARQADERWRFGGLEVAPNLHRVWLGGGEIELTPREFSLLVELARNPDRVVSKSVLGQKLDPLGEPLDAAAIEVHLSNLRRKIGAERIRTVRGVGYQLLAAP